MKKWVALIAIMTLMLMAVSALAEEDVPYKALYDVDAFLDVLEKADTAASGYKWEKEAIDPMDATMLGMKGNVKFEYDTQNLNFALAMFYDNHDNPDYETVGMMMGMPEYRTTISVACGDDGENGEWNTYAYMFGTVVNEITGDDAFRDWLQDNVMNYYIAFVENGNQKTSYNETYEGDGFTVEFRDSVGGFGYTIDIDPVV